MKFFVFVLIAVSGALAADNSTVPVQPTQTANIPVLNTVKSSSSASVEPSIAVSSSTVKSSAAASTSTVKSSVAASTSTVKSSVAASTSAVKSSIAASTSTVKSSTSHVSVKPSHSVIKSSMHISTMMVSSTASVHVSTAHASSMSSSTSIAPSASSSHVPTTSMIPPTTQPPTTTPSPDVSFVVKDKKNETCLTVKGNMVVMVTYLDTSNVTATQSLQLVKGATVTGVCSDLKAANNTASIKMQWKNLLDVSLTFNGGDHWYMNEIMVSIHNKGAKTLNTTLDELDAKAKYNVSSNGDLFKATSNHSYLCQLDQKLMLTSMNATQFNITMDFKDITLQPFASNGNKISGEMCPAKSGDKDGGSIVPIAVGCSLAGLIVIVLIAYLIGRRKGNNRGYQQV